jgi:HAD superfamily hydrolase (TIGR01484 family)
MITTLILDIEGTLTSSQGRPGNATIQLQAALQNFERSGKHDKVILCSGRELEFIQKFKSAWGIQPNSAVIAEDGCVVFDGKSEHYTFDTAKYSPELIKRRLLDLNILSIAEFDPAKKFMVTLYPLGFSTGADVTPEQRMKIFELVKPLTAEFDFNLTHSSVSVDFLPLGVDKLHGLKILTQYMKLVTLNECMYIGDSKNDLEIGKYVRASDGLFCVPQNAMADLKLAANYVATRKFDEGVLEIMKKYDLLI